MGRKSVAFPIGACFRAACNHPFVMVMLCFLAVLYRSFPYVFSLLVSAFPIIFCTGVLLGALLSFSQQKAPEIKGGEEEIIDRAVHLKTEISNDVSVQRQVESSEDDMSDIDTGLRERSQEIQFGRPEGELHIAGFELLNKEDGDGLLLKDPIPKLSSENFEVEIDKSVGSCDSKLVNIGSPPSLGSPAKHEDEEEILDSGSDQAGSCSVAEIVPMLDDELHPLLDENAPQPVNLSQEGSDVNISTESDEEKTELQVEYEDEDEDEDEDEEEIQGDKEEVTKSAIKWTEEDEKNMMEVGSSELERNQLLERVMARRKSRKWMSMMNLEMSGPPIPIVTTATRHNPFDTLPDSYEEKEEGLPPIPGSAPSILIPRQNPFDIPYYSNEEQHKSDLSGQNSGLDFFDFQPKETTTTTTTFFQGSEFLNVGPSIFGLSKQDKQDVSCESSYLAPAEESNGPGNSKLSSGLETEPMSMGSHEEEDLEDKNVIKEDVEEEKVDMGDTEEKKLIDDEHMFEEAVLISKIEHASEHVGHGSESSEEDEEEEEEEEECVGGLKNILVDEIVMKTENHGEFNSELESVQQRYNNASSTSSSSSSSPTSSEVSQRMFFEKEEKAAAAAASVAENGILRRQPSIDGSELSLVEEGAQRREPVYDSSPPRLNLRRNLSSSSLDMHESTWFPPIQVKRTVSFAEGVIMMGSRRSNRDNTEMSIPIIKEILGSSTISQSESADESETREEAVEEHEVVVSKSFPDTSNNSGDTKHHQLSEADTQDSLNQTDNESTSKSSSSSSSADQK